MEIQICILNDLQIKISKKAVTLIGYKLIFMIALYFIRLHYVKVHTNLVLTVS